MIIIKKNRKLFGVMDFTRTFVMCNLDQGVPAPTFYIRFEATTIAIK